MRRRHLLNIIMLVTLGGTWVAPSVQHAQASSNRVATFHWHSKAARERFLRWYWATHKATRGNTQSKGVTHVQLRPPTIGLGQRYIAYSWQTEQIGGATHTSYVLDTSGAWPNVESYTMQNVNASGYDWLKLAGTPHGWTPVDKATHKR